MKQELKIGSAVDDGSGDYLREGGLKINNNFNDLFYELGDGSAPHAAGAWKTWTTADGATLNAVFGRSYAINTSAGRVRVNLPKGDASLYNYVIRLRDVFATWQVNPVTIAPAAGDTIKGSPNAVEIKRNFADLEMVYCAPGRWEYIDNKQVDRISNNDTSTVATQQFIATAGQTDFLNVFNGTDYNVANLKVYHRGNLLFYGKNDVFDAANAEFGSPGTAAGQLVKLDGKNIRLRQPCVAGDTVIVVTYNDGLAQWRSSYNRRDIRILDQKLTDKVSADGSVLVIDPAAKHEFTIQELGVTPDNHINPNACEVYINSILMHEAGSSGLPGYRCENAEGETMDECINNNGTWVPSFTDYQINFDQNNRVESISIDREFEHEDILSVIWYNNDIGTTLTLDEILDETSATYVSQGPDLYLTGQVRVTDYAKPFAPNVEPLPATDFALSSVAAVFEIVHPVGTIYENTVNPNNPVTYMGFGTWQRLEHGVLVGWSADPGTRFNLNNNDLDSTGKMQATAGGTGGHDTVQLKKENIPTLETDDKVLVVDPNGPIVVGGCQFDPNSQGPAYTKYREDEATINKVLAPGAQPVDTMPPYITVYRWVRVA